MTKKCKKRKLKMDDAKAQEKKKKTVQVVMSVIRPKLRSMICPINAILCAQSPIMFFDDNKMR